MTSRQDLLLLVLISSTVSVQKTPDKFAKKKLEMATGIRPYQYEPAANINFGIDWESSSDEEVS